MKKIVIIGPESTGKSTLAAQLAAHYFTVWCPEFARKYLLEHGREYTYDNLLDIASGQIEMEEALLPQASGYYFIDTDLYVMKVWCEVAFDNCHSWILKQIAARRYDMYFLCDVDLPWVQDGLREYPDPSIRLRLFKMYKDLLIHSGCPWEIVSGSSYQRLATATRVLDTVFAQRPTGGYS